MKTANMEKYLRLVNYISAAMLYLKDNFLLEEELKREHIKTRILGHWGTVPGINTVYLMSNILITENNLNLMYVIGPGHGYPGLLSNLYVEGTFGDFYPEYKYSKEALGKLIRNFSWPHGFPSHSNPETPGVILEGGELGYSLSTAFGTVMDNPDLITVCLVGDGEAETGPTATAWHSNKFINPIEDGAVLPVVHINKYKISGPTIYGTMDNEELISLFSGYGYEPIVIEDDANLEHILHEFRYAYSRIKSIQDDARANGTFEKPRWPVILYKNKKGTSGPVEKNGLMVEDSFRSHGIPLEHVIDDEDEFRLLKNWLESYNVSELLDENYGPIEVLKEFIPEGDKRIGHNKSANNMLLKDLNLPELKMYEQEVGSSESSLNVLGDYMRDTIKSNPDNFRVLCPDETESNKLHSLFDVTKRRYMWPVLPGSENISKDGRVMEILSEHTLEGWLQGYVMTGRHGIFISYEAFMMIIASMADQYSKFLKQSVNIGWRKDLPSLNFVLTSTTWRQDHNGYSHQNPGFISSVLNDYSEFVNVHFPPDVNSMLATIEDVFTSRNKINVIVAGKRPLMQYLSLDNAKEQSKDGLSWWTEFGSSENPDIVFTATGDYATQESIMAIRIIKKLIPEIETRFISISELSNFGIGDNVNISRISEDKFNQLFTTEKNIIYSYHGYPEDIKSLIFGHPSANRFSIHGYLEKGSTTTPFDMQVLNKADRFHLVLDALNSVEKNSNIDKGKIETVRKYLNQLLEKHTRVIQETGEDIDEVTNFDKYF